MSDAAQQKAGAGETGVVGSPSGVQPGAVPDDIDGGNAERRLAKSTELQPIDRSRPLLTIALALLWSILIPKIVRWISLFSAILSLIDTRQSVQTSLKISHNILINNQ
ncbi:hypothetical protein HA50_25075 [Pantoea cypripedii]|uniref:Uncharacterized protein n=1 Tax=Pantoea cypripedii TaxID=55209 RepID=A0A1X1ELQ5_PANCY|nr:hypothetical protein [Pantoea cypripedii]ORM89870.1 hypothetical protein HA50_25075 [Pantoea cypripedii]